MNLADLRVGAARTGGRVGTLVLLLVDVAEKAHAACGDGLGAILGDQGDGPHAALRAALQRLDEETKKP